MVDTIGTERSRLLCGQ